MEDAVARGRAGGTGSIGQDGGGGGVRAGGGRDTQGRASGAGSVGWADGARGDAGVRARGGSPSSVGRLDHWVQVIYL
jgi:hypothetical protein